MSCLASPWRLLLETEPHADEILSCGTPLLMPPRQHRLGEAGQRAKDCENVFDGASCFFTPHNFNPTRKTSQGWQKARVAHIQPRVGTRMHINMRVAEKTITMVYFLSHKLQDRDCKCAKTPSYHRIVVACCSSSQEFPNLGSINYVYLSLCYI